MSEFSKLIDELDALERTASRQRFVLAIAASWPTIRAALTSPAAGGEAAWLKLVDVHRGWCNFCKGDEKWCLNAPSGGCTIADYYRALQSPPESVIHGIDYGDSDRTFYHDGRGNEVDPPAPGVVQPANPEMLVLAKAAVDAPPDTRPVEQWANEWANDLARAPCDPAFGKINTSAQVFKSAPSQEGHAAGVASDVHLAPVSKAQGEACPSAVNGRCATTDECASAGECLINKSLNDAADRLAAPLASAVGGMPEEPSRDVSVHIDHDGYRLVMDHQFTEWQEYADALRAHALTLQSTNARLAGEVSCLTDKWYSALAGLTKKSDSYNSLQARNDQVERELERLAGEVADLKALAEDNTVLDSYAKENQRLHDRAEELAGEVERLNRQRDERADYVERELSRLRREPESSVRKALEQAFIAMGQAGANGDVNHQLRPAWEAARSVIFPEGRCVHGVRLPHECRQCLEESSVSADQARRALQPASGDDKGSRDE